MYWGEGTSNNYIIYLEGGGLCTGSSQDSILQSCLDRSKTEMGSTKKRAKKINPVGLLSNDKNVNPHFYDYNKVLVPYCVS